MQNLEREGFTFSNMVDIFDAGPVLSCPRDAIRTVRASRRGKVAAILTKDVPASQYLMGTTGNNFRASAGRLQIRPDRGLAITGECARAMEIDVGDDIRFAELNAPVA